MLIKKGSIYRNIDGRWLGEYVGRGFAQVEQQPGSEQERQEPVRPKGKRQAKEQ